MKTPVIFTASCCDGKKPVQYAMVAEKLSLAECEAFVNRFLGLYYKSTNFSQETKQSMAVILCERSFSNPIDNWWLQVLRFVEDEKEVQAKKNQQK